MIRFESKSLFLSWGHIFAALLVFCSTFSAYGEVSSYTPKQLKLNDSTKKEQVNRYVQILEDRENKLTIEDVIQSKDFVEAPDNKALNIGYSRSTFWIKLKLKYDGNKERTEWWYQLDLPLLDQSEFYKTQSNKLSRQALVTKAMTYETPIKERDVSHVTQVYRFFLDKKENATIYLKIKSDFSIHLPLFVYTPEGFIESVAIEEVLYGSFFGAILILIAYNLFMFISVKEETFLFYILYMTSYLVFLITERVHGIALFGEIPGVFHKEHLTFYIWAAWFFALILARSFLETKEHEPDIDALIKMFIALTIMSIVLTPVLEPTISIQVAVFGTIPYAILMVWVAYISMARGNPVAHFYFTAWFLNFGGVVIYALTVTGYLPFNFATSNSPHFGIICQMVIISFALADRIKAAQRKASKANQQSVVNLKRYRSLFDNAVEGIFQIALNRRFIDANPAMAIMLGHETPKQLIDNVNDALNLCYPRHDDLNKIITAIESGSDIHEIEAQYFGINGETRWATSTVRIIYDQDHTPSHLEGTFIDITERVEREKDRIRKDVAEASAAAKSRFLANMSHEIRTPLTAIIGYGESLLDDSLSQKEKKEFSEIVVKSGKHLLELVNDILDHSKIDADKMKTEVITVNLFSLFGEIKSYFTPKAHEKNIEFTIHFEFPIPEIIQTDPTRLKQILINLCGNSFKFTERGSISLNVRCDRTTERLIIKIIDTGVGVKKEQLEKLFDPFAQATPSVARQYGGTGLGLSISRELAKILGGSITPTSVYGEGSVFELTVSTGQLKETKLVRNHSELDAQNLKEIPINIPRLKGSILYAEDNDINCRLVKQLVNKTGAVITIANNGAKALELATRNNSHFDLILMDIQMPIMDGRDATIAMREAGINTPIVAVTANVMKQDVTEYMEAGCTEFMPKPIEKRPFYDMLSRYLEHDQNPTELTPPFTLTASTEAKDNHTPTLSGTVLVAEDNEINRRLITRYLTKIGIEIVMVENGVQAVSIAMMGGIDLILMDQHMPEMEGPEAVKRLRSKGFDKPILAFTASDDSKDISKMIDAGCNGVLEKPIKIEGLHEGLNKYLGISSTTQSPLVHLDSEIAPIAEHFIENISDLISTMKKALTSNDYVVLIDKAHQVKGIAGALGFPKLTESAKRLESAINSEKKKTIKNHFNAFTKEIQKAKQQFESSKQ